MTSLQTNRTPRFVERFESHLRSSLGDPQEGDRGGQLLLEASQYLATATAAKRMRPLLVDYFGAAVELEPQSRLAIATAAELIHTASLLHDDVIDEGTERRGRPTVNTRWHNSVAVLGGDLVLCIALEQLEALPREVSTTAVSLVAEMTRSAMLEVEVRRQRRWSLSDWETVARGKTGALLSWCGRAPALAIERVDLARRFAGCGHHLGLAFQLTDDLLDLSSTTAGKDPYADLRNANPSFPIALARSRSTELRTALDEMWDRGQPADDELRSMATTILDTGVVEITVDRIDDHLDFATDALRDFADQPGGALISHWTDRLRSVVRRITEQL